MSLNTRIEAGQLETNLLGLQLLGGFTCIIVAPRELEEVIYQFEGVKEAAVIGINDPRKGDLVVACVAPSEGATIEDAALLGFLKDKLAAYKMPRRVMQLEALPRNATGKILKTKLREIAAEKYAR